MRIFQPAFSLWPAPRFLADSHDGLTAWLARRDAAAAPRREQLRSVVVREIVEAHHDRHARTIGARG